MRKILHRSHERGSAMFVAIVLVAVGILTLLAVSEMAGENFKRTDSFLAREQSFYAATGGTEFVVSDIWGRFEYRRESLNPEYSFRAFLDSGITFGGGQVLTAGSVIEPTDYNGRRLGNAEITRVRLTRTDFPDPTGGNAQHTDLLVEVEATTDQGQAIWASRVLGTKSKMPFAGLDYAVLTKNITCSLCHMRVQSLGKQLNTNKAYYGQYGKIRVGTTELLAMRTDSAETLIEGALYHRGRIEQESDGSALNYSSVTATTTKLKTVLQDIEKGSVKQDVTNGAVQVTDLSSTGVVDTSAYRKTNSLDDDRDGTIDEADEGSATRDRDGVDNDGNGQVDEPDEVVLYDPKGNRRVNSLTGVPNRNDSLYLEYPKVESQMKASDGELPVDQLVDRFDPSKDNKAFPEPFKDSNKNRKIDTSEINEQVASALNKTGTAPGSITVPIALKLAPGEVYGGGTMPAAAGTSVKIGADNTATYSSYTNRSATAVSLTGDSTNDGNYVLVGKPGNPIRIDGKVVINGDVIIQGNVQGEGQIYATGNVYIPNDIKYENRIDSATGNEVFGENTIPDGAGGFKRNLMGITSGGSIVVGDYLSTVTHWNSGNSKFYDYGMPEAGQKLNRAAMPSLPDTSLNQTGGSATAVNTANVNFANFVMEELSFFNQSELAKVTKTSKVASNTNVATSWTQNNRYDPATNPAGLWRVPVADPTATATTSYVPRFYRMYGDIPTPADATPTLNYGKSYNATTFQAVNQSELKDSSIPFYINGSSAWQTSKGYYNNTGDPHTYNSIAEMKLNKVSGKYVYDDNFFNGGATGDPLNPTLGTVTGGVPSSGSDNRIPKGVLDTKAIENASIINIHPSWITPTNMLNLLLSEEKNRNSLTDPSGQGVPRQVDGLLYTNNAIFMVERKQTQTNSGTYNPATGTWSGSWSKVPTKSNGSFVVNGAIIAPDLGVLVTGGTRTVGSDKPNFTPTIRGGVMQRERQAFTVNYDPRVKDLLYGISDTVYWNTQRKGWGRSLGKMP